MDPERKIEFVNSLIDSVHASIKAKIADMPEKWDGIELRAFIADYFAECVMWPTNSRRRQRDYKNEVLVRNLL